MIGFLSPCKYGVLGDYILGDYRRREDDSDGGIHLSIPVMRSHVVSPLA